jgi:hypothetical protein
MPGVCALDRPRDRTLFLTKATISEQLAELYEAGILSGWKGNGV